MIEENNHIHIWDKYNKENKLCCSICDMKYNKYLNEKVNEK